MPVDNSVQPTQEKEIKMRKIFASAILAGTIAVGAIFGAGTASADTLTAGEAAAVETLEDEICQVFDAHPVKIAAPAVLNILIEAGFSGRSTGQITYAAVQQECPSYLDGLVAWAKSNN